MYRDILILEVEGLLGRGSRAVFSLLTSSLRLDTRKRYAPSRSSADHQMESGPYLLYNWRTRILAPARRLQLHHIKGIYRYKVGVRLYTKLCLLLSSGLFTKLKVYIQLLKSYESLFV
jgi:hypothetical protein